MTKASIESKLVSIISTQLSINEDEIKPNLNFVDDLGADSLDLVEMIMEIEEEFKIEISDEDVEGMSKVKDLIDYISKVKK